MISFKSVSTVKSLLQRIAFGGNSSLNFFGSSRTTDVTSHQSDLQSRFQKLYKKYFESYTQIICTQIICKDVYATFKIHCLMAQIFASRERYYENKVANFSRLIVTDSGVLFLFLNFKKF